MGNINWSTAPQLSFATTNKTRTEWNEYLSNPSNTVPSGQIVFLVNDQTIYFEGNYIGLSAADASRLDTVISDLTALKTELGTTLDEWTTLKNSQTTLAQGLLSLKNAIDNKIGNTEYTGDSITAAISALQTAISTTLTSVKVNGKTANSTNNVITLTGADIDVSTTDSTKINTALDNKVSITTDSTTRSHSGLTNLTSSNLNTTSAIADAIEAAHAAADSASGNADTKIAKSSNSTAVKASGASSSVTGITPNSLVDGEDIAQAVEDAIVGLIGSSNVEGWSGETKTLGQLRTLIANLHTTVTQLTGDQATRITNIIQELINGAGAGTGADSFVNTMIDKLLTLMAYSSTTDNSGNVVTNGGGYYNIETGDGSNYTYANTIQGIIDALESLISTKVTAGQQGAISSAVTSVKATGATVTGTDAGNDKKKGDVELTIDSSTVKITTALTGGATTAANSSVQQALQDISNTAGSAQTAANTALGLLQWQVI